MNTHYRQLASIISGLAVVLVTSSIATGQQTVRQDDWGRGFQGFVTIAESQSFVFSGQPPDQNTDRSKSVLVLFGDLSDSQAILDQWLDEGGSVLVATDLIDSQILSDFGLKFVNNGWQVYRSSDAFNEFHDCPKIRSLDRTHPVTRGIRMLIANRPAILERGPGRLAGNLSVIAKMPQLTQRKTGQMFCVAWEHTSGGRLLAVADPSIFCNRMLAYGDNARFTLQALDWLQSQQRTNLFMLVDGQYAAPAGLDQTQIQLPPPSRAQIMEALRNLPADKMIEFGNTVATMVEDEGLVNEFLETVSQKAPDLFIRQLLITAFTIVVGFWLWLAYFSRDTLAESLTPEAPGEGAALTRKQRRNLAIQQRVWAARTMLERFMVQVTGEGLRNSENRISRIQLVVTADKSAPQAKRQLKKAIRALESRKPAWWRRRRLLQLESRVATWSQLHQQGILVYDGGINANYGTTAK